MGTSTFFIIFIQKKKWNYIYDWICCPALLLICQKNSHFLINYITSDLKMSCRTALKRFPKDWNRFLDRFFMVLTLYLYCSGT